jgi:hypothetical protein
MAQRQSRGPPARELQFDIRRTRERTIGHPNVGRTSRRRRGCWSRYRASSRAFHELALVRASTRAASGTRAVSGLAGPGASG